MKAKTNKISNFETLEVVNHKWTCLWAFLLVYQNLEPDCFVVKHISNLAQVLFQLGLQLLIHMISFVNLLVFGLFCLVLIRSLDLLEQNSCIPSITCMREVITMQHTISWYLSCLLGLRLRIQIPCASMCSLLFMFCRYRLLELTDDALKSFTKATNILQITHGTNTPFMRELLNKLDEAHAEAAYKYSAGQSSANKLLWMNVIGDHSWPMIW